MARRAVAVVGSSGGSSLLMTNPTEVLFAINEQLACVQNGARIVAAQIVCCEEPLDSANPRASAALWVMDAEQKQYERQPQCVMQGELRMVNERARALDSKLAEKIIPKVHGVVAISADARHNGANAAVLKAAGVLKKPVAGTGGTSLSLAAAMYGCELAGNAGGSVATTSRTKAIGIAASLAGVWNESYAPVCNNSSITPWRSVVNECLPALVCVACARSSARWLASPYIRDLLSSGKLVAPAVGALAATRRSDLGSIATLAGALVGSFCQGSSCCALVAGGFIFPLVAPQVLAACARFGIPATTSNLSVGGAVPVLLGVVCYVVFAPLIAETADMARWLIRTSMSWWLSSAIVGVAINYGSRRDWYHAYFLPVIALEYERGDMSAVGALDCLCLCVIGAGACAAQLVVPLFVAGASTSPFNPSSLAAQRKAPPMRAATVNPHFPESFSLHENRSDPTTILAGQRSAEERSYAIPRGPQATSVAASSPQGHALPSLDADVLLARRGVAINLLCGDYIEACHPFLERDPSLDWAVYFTSFLVGGVAAGSRSSAYIPLPLSIAFSSQGVRLAVAAIVAFVVPFIVGIASNIYIHRYKQKIR